MHSLTLTLEELEVLLPLATDQLFRNEFIDSKLPGFDVQKVQAEKAVVRRIKERFEDLLVKSGRAHPARHSTVPRNESVRPPVSRPEPAKWLTANGNGKPKDSAAANGPHRAASQKPAKKSRMAAAAGSHA